MFEKQKQQIIDQLNRLLSATDIPGDTRQFINSLLRDLASISTYFDLYSLLERAESQFKKQKWETRVRNSNNFVVVEKKLDEKLSNAEVDDLLRRNSRSVQLSIWGYESALKQDISASLLEILKNNKNSLQIESLSEYKRLLNDKKIALQKAIENSQSKMTEPEEKAIEKYISISKSVDIQEIARLRREFVAKLKKLDISVRYSSKNLSSVEEALTEYVKQINLFYIKNISNEIIDNAYRNLQIIPTITPEALNFIKIELKSLFEKIMLTTNDNDFIKCVGIYEKRLSEQFSDWIVQKQGNNCSNDVYQMFYKELPKELKARVLDWRKKASLDQHCFHNAYPLYDWGREELFSPLPFLSQQSRMVQRHNPAQSTIQYPSSAPVPRRRVQQSTNLPTQSSQVEQAGSSSSSAPRPFSLNIIANYGDDEPEASRKATTPTLGRRY